MDRRHIKLNNGDVLNLDDTSSFVSLLGYQIEEVNSGRILPMTARHEIYTYNAAEERALEVISTMYIEGEYHLVPIYDFEVEGGYIIRMSNKDFEEE